MTTAEQKLDFLRYKGRVFVEVPGLKLWLWKQIDKARREGDPETAEIVAAILDRIEQDSP